MTREHQRAKQRLRMVEMQIAGRGIADAKVLQVMRKVPRHEFVPVPYTSMAYGDTALPIGEGQTISQPYIVALMTEALGLAGGEKILEVGTGSGYAAAILAEIAGDVFTIERMETLAEGARTVLDRLGYPSIRVKAGDGTLGWPSEAPFDGIIVTAGGPEAPNALKSQLKIGGRLVMPIERYAGVQELVRVTRTSDDQFSTEKLCDVRFVPLIGAEGWSRIEANPNEEAIDGNGNLFSRMRALRW